MTAGHLVLLSNSSNHDAGYLDHAAAAIVELFGGASRIAFVPFALHDQQGYFARARERCAEFGLTLERVKDDAEGAQTVTAADGVFVGGGNTFRLLDRLQRFGLLDLLRERARGGMPYLGSSAGTVIAAPSLMTTNDMPIVQPASFQALGLVPFQINCHYLDPDPTSRHMGETRQTRLLEFHEEQRVPVVGLREGSWLVVRGPRVALAGTLPARLFRHGAEPVELPPGSDLPDWVTSPGP